jgi:hypothetical protein
LIRSWGGQLPWLGSPDQRATASGVEVSSWQSPTSSEHSLEKERSKLNKALIDHPSLGQGLQQQQPKQRFEPVPHQAHHQ